MSEKNIHTWKVGVHAKRMGIFGDIFLMGHGELLELRLLKKSAQHDFIIARHHSSNNYFSYQLLESN